MEYTEEPQVTVFLMNEPGKLADVCAVLYSQGINIEALSILDTVESATVRLITDDPTLTKNALVESGFDVTEARVIEIEMVDSPGKLESVSRALADRGINIDYAYTCTRPGSSGHNMVMKVSETERARAILDSLQE